MKLTFFLVIILMIIAVSCVSTESGKTGTANQEVYDGIAEGYRGPIHVQVIMNAGSITEITVLDSAEDRFVGEAAIEELINLVIELNSTDVDAVSGATVSSKGFLEAVNNAILRL
jgi:urocanate reductase